MKIDIEEYPVVKQHLLTFGYDRLKQTGDKDSRKKTNNKWFETQDAIGYWDDFSKQKIVWIELVDKGRFAIDFKDNYLTLNGTFIMVGKDLEYICSILNNPVTSWHFNTFCISSGVGTNQWREFYVKNLYIPKINKQEKEAISKLVIEIDKEKNHNKIKILISRLKESVYKLINLNLEEIRFIENL